MSDVARLAGVHRVTASVVLNNADASTQVSEATRLRVLEAAEELGYRPNAMALALRRQRTDIIGFYRGSGLDAHHPFFADIINGLRRGCKNHEKDLLLYAEFEERPPDDVYATLANGKADGLVTIPLSSDVQLFERLADSHLPVIAIADSMPNITSVVMDDGGGSQILAEYLASQGHRRILYRKELYSHTSAVRRLLAFRKAATERGMQVTESLPGDWDGNLSDEEIAYLRASRDQRPTAIACWADTYAYAAVNNCVELGIQVPDDIAIVGFDGIPTKVRPARCLTTIRAPWQQAAEKAVDLLVQLIEGEQVPHETVFSVELVIGDTT
jgi:DNA-binding LacI/PurR family transcriptional regulator